MCSYRRVALLALGLVLGFGLVLGPAPEEARAYEPEELRLLELINGYRKANGLAPLVTSETLSMTAKRHSEDMATYGFLSHVSEGSSYYPEGFAYYDRLAQEGYPADASTAENVAMGSTAEEAFEIWRSLPVHNANMLSGDYTAVGIGQVGPYWSITLGSVAAP